jgi:hypothetical protein
MPATTPTATLEPGRRRERRSGANVRGRAVEDALLRDLQMLIDLGLVERQQSPEGPRYALAEQAEGDRDGGSRS